jgi:hypothetical protein
VYVGRKEKLVTQRPWQQRILTIAPGQSGFVSVMTAEHVEVYPIAGGAFPSAGVSQEGLRALDVGLDYMDAANEDAHGRLPHQAGYGSPLSLVPELPSRAPVQDRRAA